MASSGAAEVVADSDQIIKHSDALDLHLRFLLEVPFRKIIVHQVISQIKALHWEVDQAK